MRDKIVLQISAGQGPKECAWVVANLYPLIITAAKASGLKVELFKTLAFDKAMRRQSLIAADSYRSVQLKIIGAQAQSFCKSWLGTVKWIGHSPYRAKHKRCNWFVAVEQVFTHQGCGISLDDLAKQVEYQYIRARGPGGQHVNKTNNAVRVKHLPSGIALRVESQRSQRRNKDLALRRLQQMLVDSQCSEIKTEHRLQWLNHYQVARSNAQRVFRGADFIEIR